MTLRGWTRNAVVLAAIIALTPPLFAARRAPLPDTALDSGILSAETLGRGGTIASNRATPAAGSENPAALEAPAGSGALYATTLVGVTSDVPNDVIDGVDPLNGRILQYLAVNADKGVLFFEPISRLRQAQTLDASAGLSRDVSVDANAIGFAGAEKIKGGSYGISIAYLWSTIAETEKSNGAITAVHRATQDGLRLNLGLRYPTGPAMWGLLIQNGPGFLWGDTYRRQQLPLRIRVGNTYRLSKGVLLSIDGERRFYREGGKEEDYIYVGNESFLGKNLVLRVGAYGTSLSRSEERRLTTGLTFSAETGTAISYALEAFEIDGEKVKRSILSIQVPFVAGE